jgi:hypothetical protein
MVFVVKIKKSSDDRKKLSENSKSSDLEGRAKNIGRSKVSLKHRSKSGQKLLLGTIYGKRVQEKRRIDQKQDYLQ